MAPGERGGDHPLSSPAVRREGKENQSRLRNVLIPFPSAGLRPGMKLASIRPEHHTAAFAL